MLVMVLKRLGGVILTVWMVATLSFFLIRLAPGNPFANELHSLSPEEDAARRREYHLDESYSVQYGYWLWDLCRGDLGDSMKYRGKTVNALIAQTFPTSLALGSMAMLMALVVGMTTGVLAALRQNSPTDYALMAVAVFGISLPSFVFAMLGIVLFVFGARLFPLAGWESYRHVILPAMALSLPFAAKISRLTRVGMLEVLGEDFIRTAYAKGLAERHVVIKHALRGAMLPVISYLGPAFALILTGSLVIEKIFFLPGLGTIFVQAATNRDYNVVLGTVVVFSTLLCFFNFLVDLSYSLLDPRVKGSTGE
ncbi:ABC transporter permease [bacterium]|nr:ABC transporter permease [bacterium]